MNDTKATRAHRLYTSLGKLGIDVTTADTLRRIEITLSRWHALECGDGNSHGSWAIVRGDNHRQHGPTEPGEKLKRVFVHNDDGSSYLEHHHYLHGHGKDCVTYTKIPDREMGARKRLVKIMAAYPDLVAYVQSDPRGCALYVGLRSKMGEPGVECQYTRGVAVCL